ncbi:MAG: hypothetical protein NTZ69_03440 [Bacteroidia bacterium]|nr:hypothetical protein [Bacteroidia bacterium]
MNKIIAVAIAICFSIITNAQDIPAYSNFPVKLEKKEAGKVNLSSHPKANNYRTNLKNALKNNEVNFAGKYIIAQWGCGTCCTETVIIDAKTGNVFFPVELQGVLAGGLAMGDHDMVEYKKDSRLLVIYGYAGSDDESSKESPLGISYYLWTNGELKLLKFVDKKN